MVDQSRLCRYTPNPRRYTPDQKLSLTDFFANLFLSSATPRRSPSIPFYRYPYLLLLPSTFPPLPFTHPLPFPLPPHLSPSPLPVPSPLSPLPFSLPPRVHERVLKSFYDFDSIHDGDSLSMFLPASFNAVSGNTGVPQRRRRISKPIRRCLSRLHCPLRP